MSSWSTRIACALIATGLTCGGVVASGSAVALADDVSAEVVQSPPPAPASSPPSVAITEETDPLGSFDLTIAWDVPHDSKRGTSVQVTLPRDFILTAGTTADLVVKNPLEGEATVAGTAIVGADGRTVTVELSDYVDTHENVRVEVTVKAYYDLSALKGLGERVATIEVGGTSTTVTYALDDAAYIYDRAQAWTTYRGAADSQPAHLPWAIVAPRVPDLSEHPDLDGTTAVVTVLGNEGQQIDCSADGGRVRVGLRLVQRTFQVDTYKVSTAAQRNLVVGFMADGLLHYREDRPFWGKSAYEFVTVTLPADAPMDQVIREINIRSVHAKDIKAPTGTVSGVRPVTVAWELGHGATHLSAWGPRHDIPQRLVGTTDRHDGA